MHDARVFVNSTAFKLANEGNILNGECVRIGDVDVPIFLVADSAYPLSTWLMKPFPHGSTLTQGQKTLITIYLVQGLLYRMLTADLSTGKNFNFPCGNQSGIYIFSI